MIVVLVLVCVALARAREDLPYPDDVVMVIDPITYPCPDERLFSVEHVCCPTPNCDEQIDKIQPNLNDPMWSGLLRDYQNPDSYVDLPRKLMEVNEHVKKVVEERK